MPASSWPFSLMPFLMSAVVLLVKVTTMLIASSGRAAKVLVTGALIESPLATIASRSSAVWAVMYFVTNAWMSVVALAGSSGCSAVVAPTSGAAVPLTASVDRPVSSSPKDLGWAVAG